VNAGLPDGAATSAPLVVWDPVPGASSYFVEMVPFTLGYCDWTAASDRHWQWPTAVTAWTPLGARRSGSPPFPSKLSPTTDGPQLKPGTSYCVRVRARADRDERGNEVQGDFTYLGGGLRPSFTF